jgi:uncharacterized membrane protein (DUF106 family)
VNSKLFINKIAIMKDTLAQITDTLSRKPEYGLVSSMLSISMSATEVLQFIGVILGLFIASITAVLKVMELIDKLKEKRIIKKAQKKRKEASTSED